LHAWWKSNGRKIVALIAVYQRWVAGEVKEPPACPRCNKQFLEKDSGWSMDLRTGKTYRRANRTEYFPLGLHEPPKSAAEPADP
jgi:hypothetical protein